MFQETTAYKKIVKLNKRIRGIAGGTSASKTISILQWLIDASQHYKGNLTSSVVSETMPHLKRGAIRDFLNIMQEHGYFDDSRWNKTDFIYDFSDKSGRKILEFFSADQPAKVRGPRRDILFINEANNVPYETFTQLEIRTRKIIWLDWNPVSEFWFYANEEGERPVKEREDCDFIVLTYKDNEALDLASVKTIEMRKGNKNWWKVYGEGLLGDAEGRIYKGWNQLDEIPDEARLKRKGLDFGYTNDHSGLVDIYVWNNAFILDELMYRKGMSNKDLADVIKQGDDALVVADSAEPKSIDEIASYGISIIGSQKGPGSVLQGIQYVQDQTIYVTKRSLNIWKEYRNYLWLTDKNGKIINEPQDFMDHLMSAIRYGMESLKPFKDDTWDDINKDLNRKWRI
jgi:phage terminase large subunit